MRTKKLFCVITVIAALLLTACSKAEVEYYYSPGDAFVTNVYSSDGTLVKAVVTLGMRRDATTVLEEKNAVVRDAILRIIRNATLEELQAADSQDKLSETMTAKLNEMFPPGSKDDGVLLFTRVYFTDFVVQ